MAIRNAVPTSRQHQASKSPKPRILMMQGGVARASRPNQ